jgi:uncharacterized protein (DUF488 family)
VQDVERLFTVGVYGFGEDSFYDTLLRHGVDVVADVRARRGLRGSEYAFANAGRLQAGLEERGIAYVHLPHLAPSDQTRAAAKRADREQRTPARARASMAEEYVEGYTRDVLDRLVPHSVLAELGQYGAAPALLCVERTPGGCHRSLLALRLAAAAGVEVEHLVP